MKNAGILSRRTAIETNTISRPDEVERVEKEERETLDLELEKTRKTKEIESQFNKSSATTNE